MTERESEKEFNNLYSYIGKDVELDFSQCEEIFLKNKETGTRKIPNRAGTIEYTFKMVNVSLQSFRKFPKAYNGIKNHIVTHKKTKYYFLSRMKDETIIIITF